MLIALACFADRKGQCYPGQARLAVASGFSLKPVRRALRKLEHERWITIEPRGPNRTFVYALALHRTEHMQGPVSLVSVGGASPRPGGEQVPTRGGASPRPGGEQVPTKLKMKSIEKEQDEASAHARARADSTVLQFPTTGKQTAASATAKAKIPAVEYAKHMQAIESLSPARRAKFESFYKNSGLGQMSKPHAYRLWLQADTPVPEPEPIVADREEVKAKAKNMLLNPNVKAEDKETLLGAFDVKDREELVAVYEALTPKPQKVPEPRKLLAPASDDSTPEPEPEEAEEYGIKEMVKDYHSLMKLSDKVAFPRPIQ